MSSGPRPSAPPTSLAAIARTVGATAPEPDLEVRGVTLDSRAVVPGDLYAALPGFRTHGAQFVGDAVAAGAVAVLTDASGEQPARASGVPVLVVDDPRGVLGAVSAQVYGDPSRDLLVIGVTGTNGKTTMTYLVDAGLRAAGYVTGVIGTVGTRIGDDVVPTVRTTPEAPDVHALLAVMRERGVQAVTMEVSSHALRLGRVDGVRFTVAAFTNLSADHLDFHRDMDDYFDAKAELFRHGRSARAVVCVDDVWGERLAAMTRAAGLPTTTYAVHGDADWVARDIRAVVGGSSMLAVGPQGLSVGLEVGMPGEFNDANALGSLVVLVAAGVGPHDAAQGIADCQGVPGRMERVPDPDAERGLLALVDYAHSPDSVALALDAVRTAASGRVVVVLGAGGDRDPHKRPHMGEAAARRADVVVVTDDNPRTEDPAAIRRAVLEGVDSVPGVERYEIGDRAEAIGTAVALAGGRGVVLVLGKGHELGQEVAGVVTPFDDRRVLAAAMAATAPRATR